MTAAKVALGRALFYDTRLSINGEMSCGSCHRQELAFTDGRPVAIGTTGELSLGGYAKRLLAYELLFGATRAHLARYGDIIADAQSAADGLLLAPADQDAPS